MVRTKINWEARVAHLGRASKTQPAKAPEQTIPVCRPWAPPAEMVLPYLRRIDGARWYTNFGPLNQELEQRIAARFDGETHVVTLANGTLALALALRARAPQGGLCLMPAWTFVATAHAAMNAGLAPYLVDVDPCTGALTPDGARSALRTAPNKVAAIVPVLPFGAASSLPAWRALEEELGIPVIVDAAAAFDAARDSATPLIVSLHATKALGAGEGGFFATQDKDLADSVRALSVFGFKGVRISAQPAFNAKLSEYHAAVALAALDAWPQTRQRFASVAARTRAAFKDANAVSFQEGWGADWISTTAVARFTDGAADFVQRQLARAGIETRRWWDHGLHKQPAFRTCLKASTLSATNMLAGATLGLPFSIDLANGAVDRVAFEVREALERFAVLQVR
jgi:dTDP-4-amino-4,6-dideoxygalactose transaminase